MACCGGCDSKCNEYLTYQVVKYLLIIASIFFWLVSAAIMGLGIFAEVVRRDLGSMNTFLVSPAAALIAAGLVVFVVTFLGMAGALRDNLTILKIFIGLMITGLLLQLIVGLVAFAFKDQAKNFINDQVSKGVKSYFADLDFKNTMDWVQERFYCCGGADYEDWEKNDYFRCASPGPASCGVPHTCCDRRANPTAGGVVNTQCGYGVRVYERLELVDIVYIRGCTDAVLIWFEDNFDIFAGLCIGLLLPQILGIIFAGVYIRKVSSIVEEERTKRRYFDRPDGSAYGFQPLPNEAESNL
ncbi:TSPAN15 [Branchiostoma lanceolatum]|uniref:Tetraspanin n=1 Tax=Branchiostoma lanceolatum TaxID=7740 RepID=A0A8J9Z403_BRALA|nr:TSPAN15 [Branchiostoma lanceolatum]